MSTTSKSTTFSVGKMWLLDDHGQLIVLHWKVIVLNHPVGNQDPKLLAAAKLFNLFLTAYLRHTPQDPHSSIWKVKQWRWETLQSFKFKISEHFLNFFIIRGNRTHHYSWKLHDGKVMHCIDVHVVHVVVHTLTNSLCCRSLRSITVVFSGSLLQ